MDGKTGELVDAGTNGLVLAPESRAGHKVGASTGATGGSEAEDSGGAVARLRRRAIST